MAPEDFPRFRQLGVISALQLLWAKASPDTIEIVKPYLDPQVYKWQYPARSVLILARLSVLTCGPEVHFRLPVVREEPVD